MRRDDIPVDREVEAAIVCVLDTEADAREAVTAAVVTAAECDETAREAAQKVVANAERRIRRLREAFEARTRAAVAAIEASTPDSAAGSDLDPDELRQLDVAVAALAMRLTRGIR